MTEKEKMLKGMLYDATDSDLDKERINAKDLCQRYNSLSIKDEQKRDELIRKILGKAGKNVCILPNFWCDFGYLINVGDNFFANHGLVILDAGGVTFGDNVLVGPNCGFHTATHPKDTARRNKGLEYGFPITVGNNVWFGAAVQVMPGVTIGDDCVIGAGSIVTKDIPPLCVAMGNPCRVIKTLDNP